MALKINTFSNQSGGNAFYKAVTHPLAAEKAQALLTQLQKSSGVAIYDPNDQLASFVEFFPLNNIEIAGYFVQDVEKIGTEFMGHKAQPVTQLSKGGYTTLFVASFDTHRINDHIRHLIQGKAPILSLDALRLPDDMLSNRGNYLANINFATNIAFFRDQGGDHTRLVTANYWGGYGAKDLRAFCCLMDEQGKKLAEWTEALPPANASIIFDSAEIRARHKLPEFTGQLFIHILGAAGHEIVKYALDTYGDAASVLSCTHDANAWPSDQFAGLPAPAEGETVVLWIQNSHPAAIPANTIGLNLMGDDQIVTLPQPIAPFATYRLDVAELFPNAKWPQQFEIQAGKHFVRPRYEITASNGHRRIAHPNVERADLKTDAKLPQLGALLGKLHIVPAPVLPVDKFVNWVLPTPMSTGLKAMPVKVLVYDARGTFVAEHSFGNMARNAITALNLNDLLQKYKLDSGYGHVELVYDFTAGQEADGWLHALFRYEDKRSGHSAETSFGSHIFNTVLTYKNEPQSYAGKPPGLSTRLFLRTAPGCDTRCHLVYPASDTWHATSDTALILTSNKGQEIAKRNIRIPCSGSLLWRVSQMFNDEDIKTAGPHAYVIIRDTTCRLFGYHGLISAGDEAFSLDHMFGF